MWANVGVSAHPSLNGIFTSMVASLRFGPRMPFSLRDIYGDALKASPPSEPPINGIASDWWSPVIRQDSGLPWNVNCGSSFHTGMPIGSSVSQGSSSGVDLRGMYGFSANGSYPSAWTLCGTMGRP